MHRQSTKTASDPDVGTLILNCISATASMAEIVTYVQHNAFGGWMPKFKSTRVIRHGTHQERATTGQDTLQTLTRRQALSHKKAWSGIKRGVDDPQVGAKIFALGARVANSRDLGDAEAALASSLCVALRVAFLWKRNIGEPDTDTYTSMLKPLSDGLAYYGVRTCAEVVAVIAPAIDQIIQEVDNLIVQSVGGPGEVGVEGISGMIHDGSDGGVNFS